MYQIRKSFIPLLVLLFILVGSQSYAKAVWVHGTSGKIQGDPAIYDCVGWGLDMDLPASSGYWVHYSIPATKAKTISVQLYTGSADVRISEVHVYNGFDRLQTANVDWHTDDTTIVQDLNLGGRMSFPRGLGVSIRIESGTNAALSHRLIISGVGAK